ncbi:Protein kinase domain [Sesbania bispinosa]|nr:Protein kinase domain [Sesbania bispinosa]
MGAMWQSVSPKVNEWMKGKVVGCGSFGTVHLAMNKSTGGLFVVKSSHSGAGCEALDNEVRILKTLKSSPYIVQCLGTEEEEEDIWSLGCTVIEMATGNPPCWAEEGSDPNPMATILKIAHGDGHGDGIPQFPTHFSNQGLDFLSRCLVREPNKRSTTEELLAHPFVSSTTQSQSQKEYASSPAGVLEVQDFDELESPPGNDFSIRNSFSYYDAPEPMWQLEELGSSGNWITVR